MDTITLLGNTLYVGLPVSTLDLAKKDRVTSLITERTLVDGNLVILYDRSHVKPLSGVPTVLEACRDYRRPPKGPLRVKGTVLSKEG